MDGIPDLQDFSNTTNYPNPVEHFLAYIIHTRRTNKIKSASHFSRTDEIVNGLLVTAMKEEEELVDYKYVLLMAPQ